ncbi:phosphatidylglycerol lysyltransferase domain-containing protein [Jatrophihabitans fulvus]
MRLTQLHRRIDIPRRVGDAAVLVGLFTLVGVVLPAHDESMIVPLPVATTATAFAAVSGAVLLRIARGLRKRKRGEWRVAVVACAVVAAAATLRADRRPVEAVVAVALLIALIHARHEFTVPSDRRGRWFGLRAALQSIGVGTGVGLLMLYLPGHVAAGTGFWARVGEIALSFFGLGGEVPVSGDAYGDLFHAVIFAFGLAAVAALVLVGLRPADRGPARELEDDARLRRLLDSHGGRDSLGYFALREDKQVCWSPTGKAAVCYRVVAGVALASGDPVGDNEAWPGAIRQWRLLVEANGWTPAVLGCSELGATAFHREYGLSTFELGDEAIIETSTFTLEGRAMRAVRQPCARTERLGYVVDVRRTGELTRAELDELREAAARWRVDPVERGFSMALSRLGDPDDPDCVVVTARLDGRLCGLLHFVPWGRDGLSLDLMRRDHDADNGLNELMIVKFLLACPSRGVAQVSLNFAVFRDALERGRRIGAGPVLRLWCRVLLIASKWWQIDSLFRFNDKFRPSWQPRFLCFAYARDLPRVAVAAMTAEAFLNPPRGMERVLGRGRAA